MIVAVVGRRKATAVDQMLGSRVGAALAEGGHVLVTGGRGGAPAAAQVAAEAYNGVVICLTPLDWPAEGPAMVTLRTGLSIPTRNVLVGSVCDAMIALPGSHGTWQEMIVALDREVPVVLVGDHEEDIPGCVRVPVDELNRFLERWT
jgi:hypothetical protein